MNKRKAFLILFTIIIPFFLILLSYKLVLGFSTYTENQQEVIDFANNNSQLTLNMTQAEYSHLEDVQKVFQYTDYAFYILLFLTTMILTYGYEDKKYLAKLLKLGAISTFSVFGLVLLLTLINFNLMFSLFHELFFPQGNWTFSLTSFLISTFPITFFISMTFKIILLTIFFASIFILLNYLLKKREK